MTGSADIEPVPPMDHAASVRISPGTLLACFKCGDTAAPLYLLKRSAGKYVPLCFKDGEGCWERSPRCACEFTDGQGVHCQNLAEWKICFGRDKLMRTNVCVLHVGAVLSDVRVHEIYRMED